MQVDAHATTATRLLLRFAERFLTLRREDSQAVDSCRRGWARQEHEQDGAQPRPQQLLQHELLVQVAFFRAASCCLHERSCQCRHGLINGHTAGQ